MLSALLLLTVGVASKQTFDHQTKTYTTKFSPVTANDQTTMTMITSPETSSSGLVGLIGSAQRTIDIATPGVSSWSGCTPYDAGACVQACTPAKARNETFPVFQALLNALHRGVQVRILTNDYETPDCPGTLGPSMFLQLNGAQVSYYTSTTFLHAKWMLVDGQRISVSSINWSSTSFTRNRELGAILEGAGAAPLISMMKSVFEADWAAGYAQAPAPFSAADMRVIVDASPVPVVVPLPSPTQASYYSPPRSAVSGAVKVTASASPDFAAQTLQAFLSRATTSLDIQVYQITDDSITATILARWRAGVPVRLLVSSSIYEAADCNAANAHYQTIYSATNGALKILKTTNHYTYSHQKYWIINGNEVGWSTGNLSPSDYPARTNSSTPATFPPYGQAGWQSTNRDYTVYLAGNPAFIAPFQALFNGDLDKNHTFPSAVMEWNPQYPVRCGTGY